MKIQTQFLVAGILSAAIVPAAQAVLVLPTVNKIVLSNGATSSLSLYGPSDSAPAGIHVAAGDVDGDGFADLVTADSTGEAKVTVRGWDPKKKEEIIGSANSRQHFTAVGTYSDMTSFVALAESTTTGIEVNSWTWGAKSNVLKGLTDRRSFTLDGYDFDRPVGIAFDNTAPSPTMVVAGQRTINDSKKGILSIIRRNDGAMRTFPAFDQTHNGGVQVATGDVNGDGVAEIIAITRNVDEAREKQKQDCIAARIFNQDGNLLASFVWQTQLNTTVAPDGSLSGRVAVGDVNGDGRAEIILTKATADGPLCSIFEVSGGNNGTPFTVDAGTPLSLSIAGLPGTGDSILPYCALDVAFSSLPFDDAPGASPVGITPSSGTLVFGLSVVPEPGSVALLMAAGVLLHRRRR